LNSIVLAAREFLGFEICKALLEEGNSVYAFDYGDWKSGVFEEKWLEIGRNANLTYASILEAAAIKEKVTCYIPLFDYLTRIDEESIYFIKKDLIRFIKKMQDNIESYVLIVPSQLLNNHREEHEMIYLILQDCLDIMKEQNWQVVYVPTLFGPWQPEGYLFQQLISEEKRDQFLDDPEDAIFITDAVNTLMKDIRGGAFKTHYLLKSEKEGNWLTCLETLKGSFKEDTIKSEKNYSDIKVIKVDETLDPSEVFARQRKCINYFCR
jgi:hypothetical protein